MITSDTLSLHADPFESGLQYYLIANSVSISGSTLTADIYTLSDSNEREALFLDSDLSSLLDISPYVVRVTDGDKLLQQYVQNAVTQSGWSGILVAVSEETQFEALLAHLRQRLFISFSSERKGILHYSNPNVANYFLGETESSSSTESWLGIIKQVCWYGAPNSPYQGLWCKVQNHSDKTNVHNLPWVITPQQETAFKVQKMDQALAKYFFKNSKPEEAIDSQQWLVYRRYFKEAQTLGFAEIDNVYQYLTLCGEYECSNDQKEHYRPEMTKSTLIERIDIEAIQSINESQKLQHIKMLINKDESYANG